jgi:hypothetical protein
MVDFPVMEARWKEAMDRKSGQADRSDDKAMSSPNADEDAAFDRALRRHLQTLHSLRPLPEEFLTLALSFGQRLSGRES